MTDLETRAAAHQKMARIFTRQGNHEDARRQYEIARLLMGIKDGDQFYA